MSDWIYDDMRAYTWHCHQYINLRTRRDNFCPYCSSHWTHTHVCISRVIPVTFVNQTHSIALRYHSTGDLSLESGDTFAPKKKKHSLCHQVSTTVTRHYSHTGIVMKIYQTQGTIMGHFCLLWLLPPRSLLFPYGRCAALGMHRFKLVPPRFINKPSWASSTV